MTKHEYADQYEAYSGVTVTIPNGDSFSAGDEAGRTIKVECPWANQQMADNLLEQVRGVRHQPYKATGAILDPAAEMGDPVTIDGVTGVIFRRDQRFGTLYRADLSSPGDEEINHEIPYYPPIQRAVTRVGGVARGAMAAAEKAQGDILQDRKNLIAALNREDGAPKDLLAGFDSYVRWDLKNNERYAESVLFAQVGEKARAEIGVYAVEADGETKTLAEILADQINLQSAVEDAFTELDLKADSETVTDLTGRVTKTETAQAALTTRVDNAESELLQKATKETVEELDGSLKTLYTGVANLSTRVGDAEAGLKQRVTVKDFDDALAAEQEAITELSASVDGVSAKLELKADSETVTDLNGRVTTISSSVAELSADVIKLQGRVDLTGSLSVEGGRITAEKSIYTSSNVFANKFWSNSESIRLGTIDYTPTEITSTTGAVFRALGA